MQAIAEKMMNEKKKRRRRKQKNIFPLSSFFIYFP